ncbi:MAG: ABC transporter substrate-binding protein, partial [Actinobacteria bacterium]|nr:ABC transporter substrate-binding protein [Actinomycetota bacterium]
ALLATACGSTVQPHGAATALDAGQAGAGLGDAGTGTGTQGAAGAAGAAGSLGAPGAGIAGTGAAVPGAGGGGTASGGTTGPTGTGPGAAGRASGSSAAGGSSGGVRSPGVTATTIALGLPYSVNSQAAAAALGAGGAGVGGGNGKRQWQILLNDINARGGIAGHKLVPVWHENDSTSSQSTDEKESAACADWTQDNKVFAAVDGEASTSETLQNCLHKAGVVQLYEDLTRADGETFRRYPYYLETGTLRMDRVAAFWPRALDAQKYFTGWDTKAARPGPLPVKVGIISFDDRTTVNSVQRQLKPALQAVGHAAAEWIRIQYPTGTADNGSAISAIQAAELKFASQGITHVLPFDAQGAGIGAFFAQGADSQKYYPRYGLNSGNGTQILVDAGLWPTSQLAGALGYGWVPLVDVRLTDNPDSGPLSNDARRRCVALMTKGGEDVGSAIVKRQVTSKCDALQFLEQALQLGGSVTRDALVAGANRIGSTFSSGQTFGTRFDAEHHDGAAYGRSFAYTASCGCFRYTAGSVPIP